MLHHYFGKGEFYYIFFEKGHNKTIRGISLKWVIQVFFFFNSYTGNGTVPESQCNFLRFN